MPQPQAEQNAIQTRLAPFRANASPESGRNAPASLNEQDRSVDIVLATEAPVPVWDWEYGRVDEVLLMSGVVLPDSGKVPLLDSHNRFSVKSQLGSLRDFTVQGDRLQARAHFSSTAEEAFSLVREGHLTDVSVGYRVLEHVYIPEKSTLPVAGKNFAGPVKVVTRWEVKEGSFTPIGADKNAKARAAEGTNREEETMPGISVAPHTGNDQARAETHIPASAPETVTPAPETPPPSAPAAPSAEAIRAEVADIVMLGRRHGCAELAETAIRNGTGLDQFRAQVLNFISERSARHAPSNSPHVESGQEEGEKFRAAVADALCLRAGTAFAPEKPRDGAEQFRGYTTREIARECLRRAGLPVPHDPMDMIGRAFTAGTSDFPNILADVMHKAVLSGAAEAAETFEAWTGETSVNDFRLHTGVDLNAFSGLDVVREHGEYTTGRISDSGVRYSVVTFGKLFSVTRQAIINDDLNVLTRIPAAMGRAAMRTCGNAVYELLISNPQMADGQALFSAARGNLATSGSKVSADTYGAAVTAMGTQKGDQGETLNIAPAFLIVPVSRKAEAHILLRSQVIGTQSQPNQINPWAGDTAPVIEGRLDAVSGKPWFLAGPKGWGINTAWLFGNKTPRIEQRMGWTVDGVEHKVSLDFGAFVQDPRALYKNPGA